MATRLSKRIVIPVLPLVLSQALRRHHVCSKRRHFNPSARTLLEDRGVWLAFAAFERIQHGHTLSHTLSPTGQENRHGRNGPGTPPQCRRHHRRAQEALRRAGEHRARRARAARQGHLLPRGASARRRGVRRIGRGSAADRPALRPPQDADHRLRHRHLAGGPYQRAQRRHLARRQPHEQGAGGQRGRPRRGGAARRHAQAAQRIYPRHRPLLPDRSRRRRLARRHGQHARLGHQRGALRHHARERAGAAGRHRRRPADAAGPALAQVLGGLRPREAVRRLRGHAGHHHRDHAPALRHPRIDGRRRPAPSIPSRARSTP